MYFYTNLNKKDEEMFLRFCEKLYKLEKDEANGKLIFLNEIFNEEEDYNNFYILNKILDIACQNDFLKLLIFLETHFSIIASEEHLNDAYKNKSIHIVSYLTGNLTTGTKISTLIV